MDNLQPKFNAPIPGESLTAELGSRPWQKPPQYNTVDEAVSYYVKKIQDKDVEDSILDVLELGIPVTIIANTIQTSSVMEGKHSLDVGLLVLPVLIEMLMYIGDKNKVKYDSGLEKKSTGVRNSLIARAIKSFKEADKNSDTNEKEMSMVEVLEEPKGLMARRNNNNV
tara:strand:- start:800 stop:1303 length:504 start_codon:yes stop_codon:yes gene_type:complete